MDNEDELTCPVCKSDPFLTPSMVLMVSPCYHLLCNSCVDRLFMQGQAPCPQCGNILRKSSFHVPKFADLRVEKECRIRRQVARCLNKRPEDFATLREYNDYLEEVEKMVFQLVNDVDVEATMARLDAYRRENAGIIDKNATLDKLEAQRAQQELDRIREAQLQRENEILTELEEDQRTRMEQEAHLIDALAERDGTPSSIASSSTSKKRGDGLASILTGKRRGPSEDVGPSRKQVKVDDSFLKDVVFLPKLDSCSLHNLFKFYGEGFLEQMAAGCFSLEWSADVLRRHVRTKP
jgi:CDK-activating kinase assembly factor MAT1